jgi:extracellular factor (EF) 3-hydroxypalmitic acid methyl ester biosynthesis protein
MSVDDEITWIVRSAAERLVDDLKGISDQASVDAALDRCLASLATTNLWGKENQGPSFELWRIAGEVLEVGGLQHRARFKPRGYAGDFEMLADFWNHKSVDSPIGRLFDRYFLKQAAVEAVRARMEWAGAMIADRCAASSHDEFRVVSIGSGPAIDLFEAARALEPSQRARLRFTIVDMEEAALDAARARLESIVAPEQIVVRRENLFRLATSHKTAEFLSDVDFVLCTGLFDYLADDVAVAQLKLFWNALRTDGTLMVGNFAPQNPTRAYMEWLGNWYLIYRDVADLDRLADAAGIPAAQRRIEPERTGCDLFLIASRRVL